MLFRSALFVDMPVDSTYAGDNNEVCGLLVRLFPWHSIGRPGKAMAESAKLSIAIRSASQGKFRLTISDIGAGMPGGRAASPAAGAAFGMRLVDTLTRQVDDKIDFSPVNSGTIATLNCSTDDQV